MQLGPLLDECSSAARQLAVQYLTRRDGYLRLILAVLGVEVRWWMIIEGSVTPEQVGDVLMQLGWL